MLGGGGNRNYEVYKLPACPVTLWKDELPMPLPKPALLQLPWPTPYLLTAHALFSNILIQSKCLLIFSILFTRQTCSRVHIPFREPPSVSILHGNHPKSVVCICCFHPLTSQAFLTWQQANPIQGAHVPGYFYIYLYMPTHTCPWWTSTFKSDTVINYQQKLIIKLSN